MAKAKTKAKVEKVEAPEVEPTEAVEESTAEAPKRYRLHGEGSLIMEEKDGLALSDDGCWYPRGDFLEVEEAK